MSKTVMQTMLDSIPESYNIREKALEMDEKEFDLWWWETIYKNKNHLELEKKQLIDFSQGSHLTLLIAEQYYNLKFKDNDNTGRK